MSTELTKPLSSAVPEFMRDSSLATANEMLGETVRPQRLKIIQPTAKPPLSDKFSKGDTILVPVQQLMAKQGEKFTFVPLLFYMEWLECNPLNIQPMIIERTLDPRHDIAVRSRRKETRKAPHPTAQGKFITYREVLNFIVAAISSEEDVAGMVTCVMSFSGGENKTGSNFRDLLLMRGTPMFGTVWHAKTSQRENQDGVWFGFDIAKPEDTSPFVQDEELFNKLHEKHKALKQAYDDRLIEVDHDDDGAGDTAASQTKF